jgi:hypothetical protein
MPAISPSTRRVRDRRHRLGTALAAALLAAPAAFAQGDPCVVPDNGTGTVTLPPAGCEYLSPDEFHMIVDGLPPGTNIIITGIHRDFICKQPGVPQELCNSPGGVFGGEVEQFQSTLNFDMQGTGMLAGFQRKVQIPAFCEVHTGPRNPGAPVQMFPTEMMQLQGAIVGDPDFDLLQVHAGAGIGLPSPGHTTLTRLGAPGSPYQVDSFFDITYRIDFAGAPGGPLAGLSGSTVDMVHVASFGPGGGSCVPDAAGGCPDTVCPAPGQQCSPVCANFNPANGAASVTACNCVFPDQCRLVGPGGGAAAGAPNPCIVPDNTMGTITLPPQGCAYLSPDEVHLIIDGLPAGTEIHLEPIHQEFICGQGGGPNCPPPGMCEQPGGNLGGHVDCFSSFLMFEATGTGMLSGFHRFINMQTQCQVHTAPRTPGSPVQSFDTDMFGQIGQIIGDPDFDLLRVTAGTNFGMPSPGHTTLYLLPGGNFAVDSFFDITYRIDFVGAPGGPLAGMSGSTTATIRMQTGNFPKCKGFCPAGTDCVQTQVVLPDGTIDLCCECIPAGGTGACCFDADGDGLPETCSVMTQDECKAIGGSFEGPGTACIGTGACCFGIIGGGCVEVDGLCCDNFLGSFVGVGSVCLGDSNGDGLDDACAPPPPDCEPNPAIGGCPAAACPGTGEVCTAVCAHFDPATGAAMVTACDCRQPNACQLVGPGGGGAGAGSPNNPCVVPDDTTGTVTLPPAGCAYLSPDEVHMILDGLPMGTEIHLEPIHRDFICKSPQPGFPGCPPPGVCEQDGGTLGGRVDCFMSELVFEATGTGLLGGFNRTITVPTLCQVHTAPRLPGAPVQSFDTEMFFLQGQIFGDPDFDLLKIRAGGGFGLPSPGHTTLTKLPGGNFAVDSFFDITYEIEFVGAPGGPLGGMSGSTTATIRMQTGNFPHCKGLCPAGQTCIETQVVNADGSIDICCDCVSQADLGACCIDADGDGVPETCTITTGAACASQGGAFLGAGTACLGDSDGDGFDDACVPPQDCGPIPGANGCIPAVCDDPAAQQCVPTCARLDPSTGAAFVLACDCRGPDECQLVIDDGPPPLCPASASQGPNGCVVPNVGGTVILPPAGCSYLSPDDVHLIVAGLPAGTTIQLGPEHTKFSLVNSGPGGTLGGQFEQFSSFLLLDLCGTGQLQGFQRFIGMPIMCESHTAPRTPGDPVQSFDTTMFLLQGQITGDPDFDLLRITAGNGLGLPSPGHTTLVQLPGGNFAVDSFFDITYRIDFVGKPGGPLGGMSGSTTGTIRMATGGFPQCQGGCPPGQQCVTQRTVNANGTIDICCECEVVCPADTNNDGQVNVADLVNVVLAWGPCPAPCPPCAADVNGDCQVNVTDLVAVVLSWGPCP